jgi:TP901 family phage tail tape measure protein
MAETNIQATLGLQITAKDEAKSVFEQFATNLNDQMKKIQESMKNAFNMTGPVEEVEKAATQMNEALKKTASEDGISSAMKRLMETTFTTREELVKNFEAMRGAFEGTSLEAVNAADLTTGQLKRINSALEGNPFQSFANKGQEAFDKLNYAVILTESEVTEMFNNMKGNFESLGNVMDGSMQMGISGMKEFVQADMALAAGTDVVIKVIKDMVPPVNEFKQAEQEMADTTVMTKTQMVEAFNAIKASFANGAYAAVDASQLTSSQLRSIVESANQMKVTVVSDMQETADKTVSAMDRIRSTTYMTSDQLAEAFNRIKASESSLANLDFSQMTESQMRGIVEAANSMSIQVVRDFKQVEEEVTQAKAKMDTLKSVQFGEIMNAGMMMQQAGEKVVGFFGEAVKAGVDFNQSIVNATASLNANLRTTKLSTDQIDEMQRKALEFGSSGFFSANKVAEAINTMSKAGLNYNEIMNGGIKVVHDVAAANQSDIIETATTVSDIYNEMRDTFTKTGQTAQQAAQQIGNGMTVAMHHSNISMSDFLNTMKYVGPVASTVGLDFRDVATEISLLGQHGIKASQAGTALRRELTNVIPQSKEAAAVMKKLGLTSGQVADAFFNQDGSMRSLDKVQEALHQSMGGLNDKMKEQAIKAIFGQYALAGMNAVVSASPAKFKELREEMNNNNEMTEIMGTKSEGLGFQVQKMQAHFATLQKEIGLALAPMLTVLITLANKLMDAWQGLPSGVQKAIIIFGAVSGVLLTVVGAIFTFIGTVGMFAASWGAAMEAFAMIGTALAPVLAAVAILAGVFIVVAASWKRDIGGIREYTNNFTAWFTLKWNETIGKAKSDIQSGIAAIKSHFSKFKDFESIVKGALGQVWLAFNQAFKKVVSVVSEAVTAVTGWFKKMAPEFGQALSNIVSFLKWLSPLWTALWVVLKFVVGMVFDWIVDIVKRFWGVFSGVIQLITDLINGNWKKAFQDLWQIVSNAFMLALDLWGGFVGKGAGFFAKLIEHTNIFGKGFSELISSIFKFFESTAKSAWSTVETVFRGAVSVVDGVLRLLIGVVTNVLSAVIELFTGRPQQAMQSMQWAFQAGISGVRGILGGILSMVDGVLGGLPGKMLGWARNAMSMFSQGIQDGIGAIGSAVSGAADKIKSFLGFHSPAKEGPASKGESDMWMPNLMNMLAKGIDDNKDKVQKATLGVALGIQQSFSGTQQHVHSLVGGGSYGTAITNNSNQRQVVVNINVEGRSAQTDKQLTDTIFKQFRTQMSMVTG